MLPNLLVSLHPDYVLTHRLEPLAPRPHGRRVPVAVRAGGGRQPPGSIPSFAVDFWDLTNRQDWAACEAVQRGVSRRGATARDRSPHDEDGVAQFVERVADADISTAEWRRSATVPD